MGEQESIGAKAEQLVSGVRPTANRLNLAGVFGLVAPLAATLGLFKATGSIGRIQRDHPQLLLLAIALVLVAGTMLAIASFLAGEGESAKGRRWEQRLFFGAAISTAAGFVLAIALVFNNAADEPRPAITATLSPDQSMLTAHVTATNLKTNHRLALKIDLATVKHGETVDSVYPFARDGSLPLERTYVGPDSDGNVDQTIKMAVPTGGNYTNLVVKAYTSSTNKPCRVSAGNTDSGTACTILYLDPDRGLSKSSLPR